MSRTRLSVSYDILNGIHLSSNLSAIIAYLSYFPPPPPVIPSPPPRRSWTCSDPSFSSSCLISDDLNPISLRQYVPFTDKNQSILSINASHASKSTHQTSTSPSIIELFSNHFTMFLLFLIFFSIFIFVISFVLLILCVQRLRQRQLTSSRHHGETNNNNNNNSNNNTSAQSNNSNNKNSKFYYHLIPYRGKHPKHSTTLKYSTDGNIVLRLSNHDSPVLEVKRLSKASGTHTNNIEEQEEAL